MSDLGSTSALYPARPSFALDGTDDPDLAQGLLSLSVEETTDGLFRCEACFGNWGSTSGDPGFLYFDRRVLDFGKSLSVEMGADATAGKVFEGRIMALEGRFPDDRPPELMVLAEDRFQDLRMTRRSRTFEDMSDSEVIEEIAGEHGLEPEVDVDGPTYAVLTQVNQSDLAFLRERARAVDAELWLEGSTLHAQARSRRERGEVTLTYGQGLRQLSVCADLAHQRTRLRVGGWDVAAKEALSPEADGSLLVGELEGPSGADVLGQALGERGEQVVHLVPLGSEEAEALAAACYRRLSRRFLVGHGLADGDSRLRVGAKVRLQGLGPLFDGPYYVCEVRHTFDAKAGLRTHFQVERPWLGEGGP
ncbi:MAG: hypothetical protein MI919_23180 [Holophagales bacterium]|nr:hypothetical protein [Holophagales bacterium]